MVEISTMQKLQNNHTSCFHNEEILKELNFDETIIQYVFSKKIPPKIEFVLKDTFLHYQDGSNYSGKSKQFIQHKKELFFNFMNDILNRDLKKQIVQSS